MAYQQGLRGDRPHAGRDQSVNIYALCAVEAGIDVLRSLSQRLKLAGIIGLAPKERGDAVSGYRDLTSLAEEIGCPLVLAQSYGLSTVHDQKKIEMLNIDILLVVGWQRLIPDWLLRHCHIGAIGAHGSVDGISGGRGRSPQNWALLGGATEFFLSIFWLDVGIDSGTVIDTQSFSLTPFDDIRTSYHKASLLTAQMIAKAHSSGRLSKPNGTVQDPHASYLPQRLPQDGAVDWKRASSDVYNFIRALTRPYPGASSDLPGGGRMVIWRARPFDFPLWMEPNPGEVVFLFDNGDFLVACGCGLLLIEDVEFRSGGRQPAIGDVLPSAHFQTQMEEIIERHQRNHPRLALSPRITRLKLGQ